MLRWHGTQQCAALSLFCFTFDLRRVNRPSLACVIEKLCLSAVKDSALYKTFGLSVAELFLIKATRDPVSLSFTLSLQKQQRIVFTIVLCQWQRASWASLFCASFYFFISDTAARDHMQCKVSMSLNQCTLKFDSSIWLPNTEGCTSLPQLHLTGKIYEAFTAVTVQVTAAWCIKSLDVKNHNGSSF